MADIAKFSDPYRILHGNNTAQPDYKAGEQRICAGWRPETRRRIRLCQPERMCAGNSLDSTEGLQSLLVSENLVRYQPLKGGGGSVRPKPNILTYNESIINPVYLYPQIYPRTDAEFQRSVANASDVLTVLVRCPEGLDLPIALGRKSHQSHVRSGFLRVSTRIFATPRRDNLRQD